MKPGMEWCGARQICRMDGIDFLDFWLAFDRPGLCAVAVPGLSCTVATAGDVIRGAARRHGWGEGQ